MVNRKHETCLTDRQAHNREKIEADRTELRNKFYAKLLAKLKATNDEIADLTNPNVNRGDEGAAQKLSREKAIERLEELRTSTEYYLDKARTMELLEDTLGVIQITERGDKT